MLSVTSQFSNEAQASLLADGVGYAWLAALASAAGREDAVALWSAGSALGYSGRQPETGLRLIERALALNPNGADGWTQSGRMKMYLGDLEGAIADLERAMRLSLVDPQLYARHPGLTRTQSSAATTFNSSQSVLVRKPR